MVRFLTGLVFLTCFAAPALATVPPDRVPASHAHADALLREAVRVADERWRGRGLHPCAGEVYVYDESGPRHAARGKLGGCDVYFDRRYRDKVWQRYTNRRLHRINRRSELASLCATATHERGHNLGFDHSAGGVMAEGAPIPGHCKRWAVSKLRSMRAR